MAFRSDEDECTLTTDERRAEADRLAVIIQNDIGWLKLNDTERYFVLRTKDGFPISVKQLLWLRRIKDKLD